MTIKKIIPFVLILLVGFLVAPVALVSGDGPPTLWEDFSDISGFLDFITNAIWIIFGLVVVICLLIAAFYFVTAGGNDESIATAKKWVKNALIGIVIALLAAGMLTLIQSFLEADEDDLGCIEQQDTVL